MMKLKKTQHYPPFQLNPYPDSKAAVGNTGLKLRAFHHFAKGS